MDEKSLCEICTKPVCFENGQSVMTQGIGDLVQKGFGREIRTCMERHKRGDWGVLSEEDKQRAYLYYHRMGSEHYNRNACKRVLTNAVYPVKMVGTINTRQPGGKSPVVFFVQKCAIHFLFFRFPAI